MSKEMLINTVEGHECRIAVMENGVLEELYIERVSSASRVGNIYKGRVTNVEPAIQAAFIDFGAGKNGFLHISDVNPQYFPRGQKSGEAVGRKRPHYDRPPIQECLRRGQEVVVQMTKEGIGTKGPTMTTYLSIPGRLLVMMPGMSRLGVSRKVQDEQARSQARQILHDLVLPPDMGFIVRTAGIDRPKRELQRDLNFLTRLWKSVNHQIKTVKAPAEIYQESDLVIRTIRDVYNTDIDRIVCDSEVVARKVKDFLDMAMPRTKHMIELYTGHEGLFHEVGLESEIEKMYNRRVELRSGGWLAIDQAEALVAIDVNSGRFREHSDAETTALKINIEAANEIARQLRLRDLGGVIIIDFIDMREEKNRRQVEKAFREGVKNDRSKTKVLKISPFGIVEMTRQRVRPSLRDSIYHRCAACDGTGLIKSEESQALSVMRQLQRVICGDDIVQIAVSVTPQVAHHLSNMHRKEVVEMEARCGKRIIISADSAMHSDQLQINCTNSRGSAVSWDVQLTPAAKKPPQTISISEFAGEDEEPSEITEESAEAAELAGGQAVETTQEIAGTQATQLPQIQAAPLAPAGDAAALGSAASQEIAGPAAMGQVYGQPPATQQAPAGEGGQGRRRRRGRRGGQRHRKHREARQAALPSQAQGQPPAQPVQPVAQPSAGQAQAVVGVVVAAAAEPEQPAQAPQQTLAQAQQQSQQPPQGRRRRGRRRRGRHQQQQAAAQPQQGPVCSEPALAAAQKVAHAESPTPAVVDAAAQPGEATRDNSAAVPKAAPSQAPAVSNEPRPDRDARPAQETSQPASAESGTLFPTPSSESPQPPNDAAGGPKRPRRRGHRGGKRHRKKTSPDVTATQQASGEQTSAATPSS